MYILTAEGIGVVEAEATDQQLIHQELHLLRLLFCRLMRHCGGRHCGRKIGKGNRRQRRGRHDILMHGHAALALHSGGGDDGSFRLRLGRILDSSGGKR